LGPVEPRRRSGLEERDLEHLRFEDLRRFLLLRNGNDLYKVPFRGGFAVLKVYFGSRSAWEYATKSIGNLLFGSQTSFMPRARRRTELACLELWKEAGFRVPEVYRDVEVEGLPVDGYALLEYVEGPRFVHYFADGDLPVDERVATWRRFLPIWHRRHALAIERREPRLVHENGDLKHVFILADGDFLFFDFEMVYRSRERVREFVSREILAYLKSLGRQVGAALWPAFLAETVRHYPDRAILDLTWRYAFDNPNPLLRGARWLDRRLKPGARKPFSKYQVAEQLHALVRA